MEGQLRRLVEDGLQALGILQARDLDDDAISTLALDQRFRRAKFVDAATSAGYQETKAVTGIALSGNQKVAEDSTSKGKFAAFDPAYLAATEGARPPSGAKVAKYPTVENMLNDMMERILKGGDVAEEAGKAATAIDRELAS